MADVSIPPEKVQDPWEKNVPGLGLGRDPARTPMQWEGGAKAGFTTADPWLPVGADYGTVNVATQGTDPRSILSLYRALIQVRRAEPALSVGAYVPVASGENVLSYERQLGNRRLLVVLNMSGVLQLLPKLNSGRVLVSTFP
jgi:alpha-glucosidase